MSIELKESEEWIEYTVVGIVGSRRRDSKADQIKVKEMFDSVALDHDLLSVDTVICSGGCPAGGDRFAEWIARDYGLSILIHYPDWKRHGRGAGFVRNTKIANDSDILIACVSSDRKGGTEDTIKKFKKSGKELLYLVEED